MSNLNIDETLYGDINTEGGKGDQRQFHIEYIFCSEDTWRQKKTPTPNQVGSLHLYIYAVFKIGIKSSN